MSNQKSWARLRAILSNATIAAVSVAAPAAAAADTPASPSAELTTGRAELETLAGQLASRLTSLPQLDAVGAAAELATSPDSRERIVLAGALASAFPLASEDILLAHLAEDPDPRVRSAVARAAWVRTRRQGDTGLVRRLLGDADPDVRAAAWQAVRGVRHPTDS